MFPLLPLNAYLGELVTAEIIVPYEIIMTRQLKGFIFTAMRAQVVIITTTGNILPN